MHAIDPAYLFHYTVKDDCTWSKLADLPVQAQEASLKS